MKRSHLIAVLVGFMAIVAFANDASAYYHARMGRFLSRDPGPARVGSGGMAAGGHFIEREPYADGMNLYQYVRSNPVQYSDPSGLDSSDSIINKRDCCYTLTVKVDVMGLDYSSMDGLVKSMAKNDGVHGVGHSWIRLRNATSGYDVEGGHSGETQNAAENPEITDPRFLTYSGGVQTLASMPETVRSSMPTIPEADPKNPVRWLHYLYKDGHWKPGSGGHKPVKECSWCITKAEFETAQKMVDRFRTDPAALKVYGLTGKQCTSTAADIAAAAGIRLDPYVTLQVPPDLIISGHTIRLRRDPKYSTIRIALPEKMRDEIGGAGGERVRKCQ